MKTEFSIADGIVIKTYKGNQAEATKEFRKDSAIMANKGYYPTSQTWAAGSYGCGAFIIALLLCFILIGFIVFIYMLIVKPNGSLTVTYELRLLTESQSEERVCPSCAEKIKLKAVKCRFCGYKFDPLEVNEVILKSSNNISTYIDESYKDTFAYKAGSILKKMIK
jgi:ribosomal protein L40E